MKMSNMTSNEKSTEQEYNKIQYQIRKEREMKDPEKRRERRRVDTALYRARHPETISEIQKRSYRKHREKILAHKREKYREKNK